METKKKVTKRQRLYIPPARGNEVPYLDVSINGKRWLIPKGQEHELPPEVIYEITRSWDAERAFNNTRKEKQEEAKRIANV